MTQLTQATEPGAGIGSHALLHNGLASHAQEWQRELERAQARAWIHAVLPQTPVDPPTPATAPQGSGGGTAARDPVAASAAAPALHVATAPQRRDPSAAMPHPVHSARVFPGLPAPARADGVVAAASCLATRATSSAGPQRSPESSTAAGERVVREPPRLHVHVEEGADGLRVWIGMPDDGAGTAHRAAAVLTELRRALGADAQRLVAVFCNGRAMDRHSLTHSTTPEDSPWPLDP